MDIQISTMHFPDACKIANVFADEALRRIFFFSLPVAIPFTPTFVFNKSYFNRATSPTSPLLSCQTSPLRGYAIRPHEFQNNVPARCLQNTHEHLRGRAKPARRRISCMCADRGVQVQVLSRKPNTRWKMHAENSADCVPRSKLSFDERNFAMKKNSVAG